MTIPSSATVLLALSLASAGTAQKPAGLTTNQWREDLAFVVDQIETIHPNHSRRIPRDEFLKLAQDLHEELPGLDDRQAATRMMALVAAVRDGHSRLQPNQFKPFRHFFPVRFYQFSDGLFITCATPDLKDLVGAKILRIGNQEAASALHMIGSITSADNVMGEIEGACFLSSADALTGLGIIETAEELPLLIQDVLGNEEETSILSVVPRRKGSFDSLHARRETEWPPTGQGVTAFPELRTRKEFYENDPEQNSRLPLHARRHSAYWFQHLPKRDAVFMQINNVTNKSAWSDEAFREMYMRMFRFIDDNQVGHCILDLRFTTGGNGDILLPFVHEFIKRDHSINRPGHFFTLVGRRSFSAAVLLAGHLKNHTNVMLVGEPAGAPLNSFGDATAVDLPNSGMQLWVSARYWQLSRWEDRSFFLPIDLPVEFSSDDYFAGIDPAIEAIFAAEEKRSIAGLIREESTEYANSIYRERKKIYSQFDYWQPCVELEMNTLGYDLLVEGRREQARMVFAINADCYPKSTNAWDSLGEAQFALRLLEDSLASYSKALEIDPKNRNAHGQRAMVKRIKGVLKKN